MLTGAALACMPFPAMAGEHRSRAVAREFQREHPCPSTGKPSEACPAYRKDHIIPLACGGPDAVSNFQWQTVSDDCPLCLLRSDSLTVSSELLPASWELRVAVSA
jgi:hypothetical protein